MAFLSAAIGFSQACTPDTAYTSPGIYPDSATGIPAATELVPYSIVITVIVPPDTMVDLGGGPVYATIDSIVLTQIVNKPAWLLYDCAPATCAFPGGDSSCALFHGTPPLGSAGKDTVDIMILQYGKVSGFPLPPVADTLFDFYVVEVQAASGIAAAVDQELDFGFIPMPFSVGDRIPITSPRSQEVRLTLFDVQGRVSTSWTHVAAQGTSSTGIPLHLMSPGSYLLVMETDGKPLSRVIVVR